MILEKLNKEQWLFQKRGQNLNVLVIRKIGMAETLNVVPRIYEYFILLK